MYELFKTRAEKAQAEVFRVSTREEAIPFILAFLNKEAASEILWASCPFLDSSSRKLLACISGLHFDVTRERAAEAGIGISEVQWALADTGTLELQVSPPRGATAKKRGE